MTFSRRAFLGAACAAPLLVRAQPALLPAGRGRRAVVVGGGWGGLAAAQRLRELAPELDVVLLEKNSSFHSLPLSNRWLVGRLDGRYLEHDYRRAADAYGYVFVQAEATAIDRERRRVVTAAGTLDYDWLVLAVGIRYDFAAWFGDDRRAIDYTREHYPCAFVAGPEGATLKAKLDAFKGGNLVMTLPPAPYRCPPAPYERAAMIAWLMKSRRIRGKLIVLDPNPSMAAFEQTFGEQFREQIDYRPQSAIRSFDPFNRKVVTEFDEIRFDDAIAMAPQQAGDLAWQAGLIGRDKDGRPTGWAEPDPIHLHAVGDDRVFAIGDLMGRVSPLFGHYPKSGQLASRLGRIAAAEIAARARGAEPPRLLPDSTCYIHTRVEPPEMLRIDSRYRFRGDGLIVQTGSQHFDPQPQDDDLRWAQERFGEFLAYRNQ